MKKSIKLIFLLTFLFLSGYSQEPSFEALDLKIELSLNALKNLAFPISGSFNEDDQKKMAQSKQLFSTEKEAYQFLAGIQSNFNNELTRASLTNFLDSYAKNDGKGNKALLFFSHPIDLKKFEQSITGAAKKESINTEFITNGILIQSCNAQKKANEENIVGFKKILARLAEKRDGKDAVGAATAVTAVSLSIEEEKLQSELSRSIIEIQNQIYLIDEKIKTIQKKNVELETEFKKLCNQYVEDKTIKYYLFHDAKVSGNDFENDKYLSNIDDILIVCLGGEQDLAKMNIKINKKTNAFVSSINAANEVLTSLDLPYTIPGTIKAAPKSGTGFVCQEDNIQVPVSFIQLKNSKKLKAPYEIKFEIPENKDDISIDIHEINHFLLNFGFSAKNINPTYFEDLGDKVEVKKAELTAENSIKADAYLLLNWCPIGRDVNKFSEKGRLSFSFGLKASKDPLQSMILGPTWALNNSVALIAGIALNSLPKEGASLSTKNIAVTTDYLLKNIDREYKVGFFFGLSLSPANFKNLIATK